MNELTCEICQKEFLSKQKLGTHKYGVHKINGVTHQYNQNKTRTVTKVKANNSFDRMIQATDILFPGGINSSRVIPIAQLQNIMLELMNE